MKIYYDNEILQEILKVYIENNESKAIKQSSFGRNTGKSTTISSLAKFYNLSVVSSGHNIMHYYEKGVMVWHSTDVKNIINGSIGKDFLTNVLLVDGIKNKEYNILRNNGYTVIGIISDGNLEL